jgi:hypothetical protein
MQEKEGLAQASAAAQAEYQARRFDPATRIEARAKRDAARSAIRAHKQRWREEFQALRLLVHAWGQTKKRNRRGWCQALHTIICAGKGNGSLLFHAFPQEVIDKVAETMGTASVQVALPALVHGEIEFDEDGRIFLVQQLPNGDGRTKTFLTRVSGKREAPVDGTTVGCSKPLPIEHVVGATPDATLVSSNFLPRPAEAAGDRRSSSGQGEGNLAGDGRASPPAKINNCETANASQARLVSR